MQLVWIQRGLAAAVLAAGVGFVGSSVAKDPLPEGSGAKQLDADIKYLQTTLAGKKKNSVSPLKSTAMLIALNAQNQTDGADAEKMAGVRDQAVKVATALSKADADWDTAIKEAAAMGTAKGDAKNALKLQDLNEFDVHELMTVFKPRNRGGRGLEEDVIKYSKSAPDPKVAVEVGNLVALIGQYTELMPPADASEANKKKWIDWSKEMQKVGKEAAEAGLKGDKPTLVKKFMSVDKNCKDCHNVFKN